MLFSVLCLSGTADKFKKGTLHLTFDNRSSVQMATIVFDGTTYTPSSSVTITYNTPHTITVNFNGNYNGGIEVEENSSGNILKCSAGGGTGSTSRSLGTVQFGTADATLTAYATSGCP